MKKSTKHGRPDPGRIIGAILFVLLLVGLVVFAAGYDPDARFSSSFFDDVSDAIKWGGQ